jgi:uncharacterized cupredoxin-like copper-binding protein
MMNSSPGAAICGRERIVSNRRLLGFGIVLILVAVVGGTITAGSVWGTGWMDFMGAHGQMMWSGSGASGTSGEPIPDATELIVEADEFGFSPSTITVDANTPVNFTLVNTGSLLHDFTIQDIGFQIVATGGDRVTGGLVPEMPGTFDFVCSIPGHAQAGMTGTLIVRVSS